MRLMLLNLLFVSLSLLVSGNVFAQIKKLYLGNDTHTDLMWNGDEDFWYDLSYKMTNFYLKIGEQTAANSPESRGKWNYDVAWTLYMLEKRTSTEFFHRVIDQIKRDQASVPYNFTLATYGGAPAELILRSFYYGGYLERTYDIDVSLAVCQENATIPLGLASLWAGSGAKYSWRGVCNCATKINTIGTRDNEIYWYTGLDGSRILMKWYSNYGWNAELGGYAEMLEPTVAVIQMDTLCGTERYPYNIAGAFGKGWDNMINYSYDLVWGLGHRTRPGTKLFLSNQIDFFEDFESSFGDILPYETLTYGNEWDLYPASLSEVSGKLKMSIEQLRTAETLAAIVAQINPSAFGSLDKLKEDFLYGLSVYYLHGWTADGPINAHDFATYMRKQQQKISNYVEELKSAASEELGSMIRKEQNGDLIYVLNPLNWERSGIVEFEANHKWKAVKDITNGKIIQCLTIDREGRKLLQFNAENIPSVGYKVYKLEKVQHRELESGITFIDNTLDTPYYRIHITNSGVITSLIEKGSGKEWVKKHLNYLGSGDIYDGRPAVIEKQDNNSFTILCESQNPITHTSRFTVFNDRPEINIDNTILENFSNPLHWTFNFNVDDPEVWHEEIGAVIKAKTALNGGHYADRMARYDYLTLNHFVDVGNAKEGITLSNANCMFFKLGESTPEYLDESSSAIHVLIGGQVDKGLGLPDQDGDSVFHQSFSLLPHQGGFDELSAMKFSIEHQNPLFTGEVLGGRDLPGDKYSFMKCANPNLILWSLKPGEDQGISMRFWNLSSDPCESKIELNNKIVEAFHTTHVETDIQKAVMQGNALLTSFRKFQMKTYRITF